MIKIVIQYPATAGSYFDLAYYSTVHIPLAKKLLGEFGFLDARILNCISTVSGEDPASLCISELSFLDIDSMRAGMAEHGEALRADFANYTNIDPVATVCEQLDPDE